MRVNLTKSDLALIAKAIRDAKDAMSWKRRRRAEDSEWAQGDTERFLRNEEDGLKEQWNRLSLKLSRQTTKEITR
jgi:hypothetical protein